MLYKRAEPETAAGQLTFDLSVFGLLFSVKPRGSQNNNKTKLRSVRIYQTRRGCQGEQEICI